MLFHWAVNKPRMRESARVLGKIISMSANHFFCVYSIGQHSVTWCYLVAEKAGNGNVTTPRKKRKAWGQGSITSDFCHRVIERNVEIQAGINKGVGNV